MDERPTVIDDKYVICETLGAGGSSEVFLVQHRDLGVRRVLKLGRSAAARRAAALLLEAETLARIDHSHVIRVHDAGRLPDGRAYFVMDWIDGWSVSDMMRCCVASFHERLQIASHVADGMAAIHDLGVLHRDLKPANVLVGRTEGRLDASRTTIIDLGVLKSVTADTETAIPMTRGLGRLSGTFRYMAPEQLAGRTESAATDVFGFGLLLYELIFGTPTFRDGEALEVLDGTPTSKRLAWVGATVLERLTRDVDVPQLDDLDQQLRDLMVACLRNEERMRPRSFREVGIVLREALAGDSAK